MKKYILPILIFFMIMPMVVNAETCDTDKITISSIVIEEKSDNVVELDDATASGKNINLNLSMSEVGDYITYKVVVKNDSKDDYELDNNNFKINSDYIDYTFDTEDSSYIVKANSSKNAYIKIEYKNIVPEDAFESGIYNDHKTMTLQLLTDNNISNPNTKSQLYILIVMFIFCLSGIAYIFLRKKFVKSMILLLGILVIIPFNVYALCKCEMTINSTIRIKNNYFYTTAFGIEYKHGETIPETPNYYLNYISYEGYSDILSKSGVRTFLRHKIQNDIIISSQVGFLLNNIVLYLQGGINENDLSNPKVYESNKEIIIKEFNRSNCEIDSSDFFSDSICTRCINNDDGRTVALVCKNGYATAGWNSPGCEMFNGISSCYVE